MTTVILTMYYILSLIFNIKSTQVELYVMLASVLVPLSSPLFGFVIDMVRMKTNSIDNALLAGVTIIYTTLSLYCLAEIYIENNIIRII